jgi:hypothetical protein
MAPNQSRDISELLSDPNTVLEAGREAAADAIQLHKRLGLPLAVWRDGQVAWVTAEELERSQDHATQAEPRD